VDQLYMQAEKGATWVPVTRPPSPIPGDDEVITTGAGRLSPWPYEADQTVYEDRTYSVAAAPFVRLERAVFFQAMEIDIGATKAQVQAVIDDMPISTTEEREAKTKARIRFEDAQHFDRDDALLAAIGVSLGITGAQIDTAWRSANNRFS